MNTEILDLIDAHRDGGLSAGQQARLHELLKDDPAARRAFVQEQMLEAAFQLETSGSVDVASKPQEVISVRRHYFANVWRWAAAALVVFSIGWGVGNGLKRAEPPIAVTDAGMDDESFDDELFDDSVALVTQAADAVWVGNRQPRANNLLSAGRLQLKSGLVQLEFYSGARLILDGPVDLELVSASHVVCHSGRLRASVPPQARGFSVTSPEFKLVDLGTEFGIEVSSAGGSKVQVFDGEVELHAANQVQRLLGGAGLSWAKSGAKSDIASVPSSFPSFDDMRDRTQQQADQRYEAWQQWNRKLADDPRIAVRYDFQSDAETLRDSGPDHIDGLIVGCERSEGRWGGKGALEFKRPSDRVRVNIPGEFDALTLTAWIRVDATPERFQALLLTDGYEPGRPHWQISPWGELRVGVPFPQGVKVQAGSSFTSPRLFKSRQVGVWSFVGMVYDRQSGTMRQYLNGREVSSEAIRFDQPLRIGSAELGNWGVALKTDRRPVRNFVGRMDELTVWKVALSADEFREMHLSQHP